MPFLPDLNSPKRTNISIITMGPVGNGERGTIADIFPEIDMLKAAVLYGDSIEILSGAFYIWKELQKFQDPDSMNLSDKLYYSINLCKTAIENLDLGNSQRNAFEHVHATLQKFQSTPERTEKSTKELEGLINKIWPQIHLIVQRLVLPELPAILRLIDQKWIEIKDAFTAFPAPPNLTINYDPGVDKSLLTPELEHALHKHLGQLSALGVAAEAAISDPQTFPMLDAHVSGFIRVKENTPQPNRNIRHTATELAKGMFARLPMFDKATLDEIVEIRSELNPYVRQFQVTLGSMAANMHNVTTEEFPAAIEEVWFKEVIPEIHSLDEAIGRNRYLNIDFLQGAVNKPEGIVAITGGLFLGATQSGLASLISPGIMASLPAISRVVEHRKAKKQLEQNRFFFLYKLSKSPKKNERKMRKKR